MYARTPARRVGAAFPFAMGYDGRVTTKDDFSAEIILRDLHSALTKIARSSGNGPELARVLMSACIWRYSESGQPYGPAGIGRWLAEIQGAPVTIEWPPLEVQGQ